MARFAVLAVLFLMAVDAAHGGMTMEFVAEDIPMSTCFPLAGYLRIANESTSAVNAKCCYQSTCTGFEVVILTPGGERIMPWEMNPNRHITRILTDFHFPAFGEFRIPVFLFRNDGEFIFSEPGDYDVTFNDAYFDLSVTTRVSVDGNGSGIMGGVFDSPLFTRVLEPFQLRSNRFEPHIARLGDRDGGDLLLQLFRDYNDGLPFVMDILCAGGPIFSKRGIEGYEPDVQLRILAALGRNRQFNTGFWEYARRVATEGPELYDGVIYTVYPSGSLRSIIINEPLSED